MTDAIADGHASGRPSGVARTGLRFLPVLIAGTIAVLQWQGPFPQAALFWALAVAVATVIQARRSGAPGAEPETGAYLASAATGLCWGLGALVLFVPNLSLANVALVAGLVAMPAASAPGLAGRHRLILTLALPAMAPLVLRLLATAQPSQLLLAAGLGLVPAGIWILGRQQEKLERTLEASRAQAADIGRELQRRTAELDEALARARMSEERLASTVEQLDEPLVIWSRDGVLISCNAVARQLFQGRPPVLHPSLEMPRLPAYLFGPAAGALEPTGDAETGGFEARFDDGRTFRFVLRRTSTGDVKLSGVDLTDSRAREEALVNAMERLRASKDQAEQASRAKSTFLAHMSHELRTPLNAILGFSEIIRDGLFGPVDTRYASYASDIHSSGSHLLELINAVLDLSKIEAGKLELDEHDVDLMELARPALRLVRTRGNGPHLMLRLDIPADIPLLRADPRAITQMLLNLLSNAVKFTPAGGTVTLSARASNRGVTVMVADTGIGISERDLPKVFAPFGQVASPLSPRAPGTGTGLGVPLVKSLVELHGGSIHIESMPNAGTTVTLNFPPERMIHRETSRSEEG